MGEMIEKMAIAAWQSQHGPWEFLSDQGKESIRIEMRAALEAMREPTPDMHVAGVRARLNISLGECKALVCWQAIIDAALAEGE